MKLSLRVALVLALIAFFVAFSAPGIHAQGFSLSGLPATPAGISPTSVAAGDFNGDGTADIAVTNQTGVTILLGNGSTGFVPFASYVVGTNPQSVAVGDFNGDGKLDLAVVNQGSGTVSILLGNGDGTFAPGTTPSAGTNPRRVLVADVNGDGKQDLVIVDSGTSTGSGVSILLGNGNGTFQTAAFFPAGSVSLSVAIGDFNGDGKLDLAVSNEGSDNISILLGNGNGTFQTATNINLDLPGLSVSPTSIVAADFDGDGVLDLAVATPNHRDVAILLGNGNGTFHSAVHVPLDDTNFVNNTNVLVTADLDRNGAVDLILVNLSSNHLTVLYGAGNGTFPNVRSYAAGPAPIGAVVADFNGDGFPDVAVADNAVDGDVSLLLGDHAGNLGAAPLYHSSYIPQSFAVGDLNGDGKMDIVAASQFTTTGFASGVSMLGNGDGTFQAPVMWSSSSVVSSVALGDVDGDGKLDLVYTVANPGNGNVSVALGNGDGTFQPPSTYAVGTTPETVTLADVSGDGKLDIIVGNRNSANVSVLLNSGNGSFQAAVNYAMPNTGTPESLVVGDFNGDGIPDVAVAISGVNATSIAFLFGNGNGTFQSAVTLPSGFHSPGILRIAAADFNVDGKLDLAVTDGSTLAVLVSNGGGAFQAPVVTPLVGTGAADNGMLVVGDFDGDGKPDIAASTRDGISILLGTGGGTFAAAVNYTPFTGGAIAAGDFDGDGKLDLVAADSSQDQVETDTVAILSNTSLIPVSVTLNSSPSGVPVEDDGNFCLQPPCTLLFPWASQHVLFAGTVITSNIPNTAFDFDHWSDGGAARHTITVPRSSVTYTAFFNTDYFLTTSSSPSNGGTVSVPPGTFVPQGFANTVRAGTVVSLTAVPNTGFAFVNWTGNVANPNSASTTVTMSASQTVTANFTVQMVQVPNVVGQTQAAAASAITGVGLTVGTVTTASSSTVAAGNVISESPIGGTSVAYGSAVNLVISTGAAAGPTVVSFNVLFGSQSFNVSTSSRTRLPWQISGIRVVFSAPIANGSAASLAGASVTGFSGLGTNTLTWNITPIALGNVPIVLSGSGATALKDAAGNSLNSGAGFSKMLKILVGDFNDDGVVSSTDMVLVNNAITAAYNIFADITGDGIVSILDVQAVRAKLGTSLP